MLRARGDHVVVLDTLELGYREAIADTPLVVVRNTRDTALARSVIREHRIEAVIHFAAYKAAGESMANPGKYFHNNVHGTLCLLEAVREEGVRRFVFSSTAAVYGTPEALPVLESAPLRPVNPYGESKLMVERMLAGTTAALRLARCACVTSTPRAPMPDGRHRRTIRDRRRNLIPLVMKAATGRAPGIKVFGTDYPTPDGTCVRDYIHVLDLAQAHLAALDFLSHAGSQRRVQRGHRARRLGQGGAGDGAAGERPRHPQRGGGRRPGDPVAVFADNRKAREQLGWQPRYGLEEIVASAWRWQSGHPDGYG